MAVEGTLLDVPDSEANAKVFGYPGTHFGHHAAFPKVRLVMLIEAGTHLITDALICPYRIGERVRALKLLRSVQAGMLRRVGARITFISDGTDYKSATVPLLRTCAEEREI
jgi:transcriptional regulator of aromatic amino acid metabolism